MERRIARRYVTDMVLDVWIPRSGSLGRAKTAEVPIGDLSLFGAAVYAKKSDKLARGKVVRVTIDDETTTAIIRSEAASEDSKQVRYGLEFIQPCEEFLDKISQATDNARRMLGEEVPTYELWLRSS